MAAEVRADVVNDHDMFAANALPAASLIRGSLPPPLMVAVYVDEYASVADGVNVARNVDAS